MAKAEAKKEHQKVLQEAVDWCAREGKGAERAPTVAYASSRASPGTDPGRLNNTHSVAHRTSRVLRFCRFYGCMFDTFVVSMVLRP